MKPEYLKINVCELEIIKMRKSRPYFERGNFLLQMLNDEKSLNQFKNNSLNLNAVRNLAEQLAQGKIAPGMTSCVATSLLGIGLCQELTQRFVLEYCIKYKEKNISMVFLGNPDDGYKKEDHVLAYIGPINIPNQLIIGRGNAPVQINPKGVNQILLDFLNTNEEGVFADLLLNFAGISNEEIEPLTEYCKKYNITHIVGVRTFFNTPSFIENAPIIKQNALEIANQIKLFINSMGSKKSIEFDPKSNLEKQRTLSKDTISLKALINKEQINPMHLYHEAVKEYNKKDKPSLDNALSLLDQAIELFRHKTSKVDSEECFKCYSTIISCHRELKNYDKAINYAEHVISLFSGKIELSKVIKKYNECLKLKGDSPGQIYNQAINDFKSKQYNLALYKLLFAVERFDINTQKFELAYCHSTLASCYRELKSYEIAVEHCEKSFELRKGCLKGDNKLIKDTEKKLEDLRLLLSNNTSGFTH